MEDAAQQCGENAVVVSLCNAGDQAAAASNG